MSELGNEKLVALQRKFVQQLLGSQSSWEPVSGEKPPKGKELDFFVNGGALQWHISAAWRAPLVEDAEACDWLSHKSNVVRSQALQAVPLDELEGLVKAYAERDESWKAAQLSHRVVTTCTMAKSQQLKYYKICFSALDQISCCCYRL